MSILAAGPVAMNDEPPDDAHSRVGAVHPVIAGLAAIDKLKTWSLIATLFGDLDGSLLSGKEIGQHLSGAGIRAEAVRVALHRLKKDDWITTSKSGREVLYGLSARGRRETAAVYRDVFRRDVKYPPGWRLILIEDEDGAALAPEAVRVLPHLAFLPSGAPMLPGGAMPVSIEGGVQDWLPRRLVLPETVDAADSLSAACEAFAAAPGTFSREERATLRLLILHHWRKIALKKTAWVHIALEPGGALARCHGQVTSLLAQLDKPSASGTNIQTRPQ